jgi:hypothetical protein
VELKKKKYKKQEVENLITVFKIAYEARLAEQKALVVELNKENAELKAELSKLKDKEGVIVSTMETAEKVANDVKENAQLQYALEIERLKQFSARWEKYLCDLKERYPLYETVNRAVELKNAVDELNENCLPKESIDALENALFDAKLSRPFNPKEKIRDYIAATGDNGFNLEEVLNPGKLELEDICKELGLME